MKIICTRENLANALSLIGGVAGKNINLPILNNVLIKADSQKVDLVATNLELAITTQLRAKIEEPGSFTVPAKTLFDFINLLSTETVELSVKENELEVASGKSATKIKGTPADEFPVVPSVSEGKGYVVDSHIFKRSIEQVSQSSSKNDIRPELAGVFLNFDSVKKSLVMAATDSYRLAEKTLNIEQGDQDTKTILPLRAAQEISRVLTLNKNFGQKEKNVRIVINDNQIVMRNDDVELVSRLVDGKYPDYQQIIPQNFNTEVEFDISQLVKEVKAASLFTTTGVNAVDFVIDEQKDTTLISSASAQAGEHQSELSVQVKGERNSILLNHRYVLEGLSNIDGQNCVLKIINGDSPCLLTSSEDKSFLYIIMPIRQ
ncbi:MAG: DNA polymerase III subunit beta [Candidatus Magasanikbacteria bacterium CG10_big_fil_rev_8_21_14_0_10_40_10]|uniref:Beta sliding clamp n=1 Tax=Candidatus Magasanikbacteria bacterium CG10_big_fil_rev_8_21_14_0_10_40_10 TaxID=1974648 RepID=A0A2M6W349_9BACT|nr:MAG: DNA polymerase III subunit beta [Candidatus Magasanikbacteria bacterium CG10_big_fil_rev_8_21_14_0_10_40_10]